MQFDAITAICRDLDRHDRADTIMQLTLKQASDPHGHSACRLVRP
jgi:hypothetical protein